MSEDKLQSDINRAARAKAMAEDELFQEAFRELEASYMKEWGASQPHETRKREALYTAIQVLAGVRDHFKDVLNNGKLAKAELDKLAKLGGLKVVA